MRSVLFQGERHCGPGAWRYVISQMAPGAANLSAAGLSRQYRESLGASKANWPGPFGALGALHWRGTAPTDLPAFN
jgi:hypothetical protein